MEKNNNILGFDKEKLTRWFLYWGLVGVGLFVLVFLITTTWIGVSVKEKCLVAKGKYSGDCVDALVKVVDSEDNSFRERNYAIWALGQLGDKKALGVLNKYYTGIIPEREPYDNGLSQYELKKAINLLESGFNLSAIVWRHNFLYFE